MRKIVSSFIGDTGLNDVLLHGFVCRLRRWLFIIIIIIIIIIVIAISSIFVMLVLIN